MPPVKSGRTTPLRRSKPGAAGCASSSASRFFGGIIGFPLVLAAGVLYLCGWIVLLSLAITAVSLLLGGVASCAMMLAILGQAPQAALFQFGAGVLIIGLGILSSVGVFHLFRLYWVFSRRLSASISRHFARKGVRYAS